MIVFDIGANDGSSCAHFANDPNDTVYAFEPTPYLIESKLKLLEKENYIIVPKAVGNFCGMIDFYIAGNANWGCSSIYKFNDGLEETWPGRTDFKTTDVQKVECITMEKFLNENKNIKKIDYFHCDTQGNDLNVLLGFGEYINMISRGMIEVYIKNPLYKNINNSIENAIKFLTQNKFKITNLEFDACSNEANLHFEN